MHNKTIAQISADLTSGLYSSEDITRHFLDRIKKYDTHLNSFITVNEKEAIAQARVADAVRARGEAGPMTGVPIAQKDIFCTKGIKTSCGSKMLDNFIAPYDAYVITRFAQAGAIMLGKTNMDEFAMGSSNENSYYGPVKNPWDTAYVPGGSSGGSAAAVAAGLAPGATGTDTGGSIRQPAALSGITGLKPTYSRVSRYGMIAFASSLDQGGPLAKTAQDCAMMLNVMAGYDARDSTSIDKPVPDYTASLNDSIAGLRIGLPKEFFTEHLDANIRALIDNAVKEYEKQGASVHEISLPHAHLSIPAYYIIAPAECSSNLSRFDGVRYGYRCDNPADLTDLYKRSRGEGFGAEVKRRIIIGTYALSAGYYDAFYLKAQQIRRLIRDDFTTAFKTVDVIMSPTSPTTAFKIGARTDDPIAMYLSDIFTIVASLAGLPALSLPAGFIQGLPVGLQIIGNYFEEARLLNIAHRYQQTSDWHTQRPTDYK